MLSGGVSGGVSILASHSDAPAANVARRRGLAARRVIGRTPPGQGFFSLDAFAVLFTEPSRFRVNNIKKRLFTD